MATAPKTFEKCPRCEIRPSTPGRNRWCNECNAEYQRQYQSTREARRENKGFLRGVNEMRQSAVEHFERFRFAHFSGHEIAKMLATIPAPRFQEAETPESVQPAASGG